MILFKVIINCISSAMVSVLTSNSVVRWFEHPSDQTNDHKLVYAASLLSTQHEGVRAKTCLLDARKKCLSKARSMLRTVVSVN